jgi:hypothetical protein
VTSAAPAGISVNPAELEEVQGADDGDEAEDDVEGQHGSVPVLGREYRAECAVSSGGLPRGTGRRTKRG